MDAKTVSSNPLHPHNPRLKTDAWGKITAQSGETSNKHKFTGREWDAEINLQYNRARFYDPEIGRFITQDPLTKGPDDPTITYKNNIYAVLDRVNKLPRAYARGIRRNGLCPPA
ncbi:MAG: RHS repeat-associated core domain-containing protein [candidate division WOR-3 bacterium]